MISKNLQNKCGVCGCTSSQVGSDQKWYIDFMGICRNCLRCHPNLIQESLRRSVESSSMNMSPEKAEFMFGSAEELQREAEGEYDQIECLADEIEALGIAYEDKCSGMGKGSLAAYGLKGYRDYSGGSGIYCHIFPHIDEIARAARNGVPLLVDPISMNLLKAEKCLEILDDLKWQGFVFVPTLGCDNFDRTGRCLGHKARL